jgi:hypothetical protein
MTDSRPQPQNATRSAPASASNKPPAPPAKPGGNLTYTIQKGAGSLPFLKK